MFQTTVLMSTVLENVPHEPNQLITVHEAGINITLVCFLH